MACPHPSYSGVVSLVREWVLFILLFILSMGSRKAVLSAPRTLDMVPLGEILQGRSNQGVKALSDNSDRYISDSGILKGLLPPNWKKAWSSVEPKQASRLWQQRLAGHLENKMGFFLPINDRSVLILEKALRW